MLIAFSVANFRSTVLRRQTLGLDANSAGRVPLEGHVRKGVRNRKDEGRDFEGGGGDQVAQSRRASVHSPQGRRAVCTAPAGIAFPSGHQGSLDS